MKCPQCERNHQKKLGMVCGSCAYHFVFNPDENKGMTDGKFLGLVNRVSDNGIYYYTENQLFAAHIRRGRGVGYKVRRVALYLALIFFAAMGLVFAGWSPVPGGWEESVGIGLLAAGFVSIFIRALIKPFPQYDRETFRNLVMKYQKAHPDKHLLTRAGLHDPPPEWNEPDIYDYGVTAILVVDRDVLVDLLVLNGFHSSEGVLILSLDGYPDYLIPRAGKLLEAWPGLPVYYVHDVHPEAVSGEGSYGLNKARLLLDHHDIQDLGLFPDDLKKMPGLRVLPAEKWDARVPLDAVGYSGLGFLLGAAVVQGALLSSVWAEAAQDQSSGGGLGGFG